MTVGSAHRGNPEPHREDAARTGGDEVAKDAGSVGWWAEVALAVGAFLALCVVTLSVGPQSAEPDDGAYHASIVAIAQGHFMTLSYSQALDLARSLRDNPTAPPNQWEKVRPGRYLSEKNAGYPYLAAPFQKVGMIRFAPLFFGLLACLALFAGARRWLGPYGGSAAVGLFCSSGAAIAFAWRDYMPTFTDASLVASGCGLLLWVCHAGEAEPILRRWLGLAAFVALEIATFVRYTNLVVLACAVVVALLAARLPAVRLPRRTLLWWLSSVAVFGIGVAVFDTVAYGGPFTSGYQPGEVTFALRATGPNLRLVPQHLLYAMPMVLLATVSLVWIVIRSTAARPEQASLTTRRDLWIAAALAATWWVIWGLYATYTWTTDPTDYAVQDVRFYLPAIGPIALLGAWLVTRIPGRTRTTALAIAGVTAVLFVQGTLAFHAMYTAFGVAI